MSETFQVIAISLKPAFFERADGLVGVYRDVDAASSASVTVRAMMRVGALIVAARSRQV